MKRSALRALVIPTLLCVAACTVGTVDPVDDQRAAATPKPKVQEPAGGAPAPTPATKCATDLGPELARLIVPGLSAGIIKDGKLVCTAVAGLADIEGNRPVTPDTVFAWASVSKTVTSVTLMSLFDEGKLRLDDPIDAHVSFRVRAPACASTPLTLRHLLTHTSSIIDGDAYDDSYADGDSPIALGDFLRSYLVAGGARYDAADNFGPGCPGTAYEYSNVATALAAYAAESITKVPFDQLARERVFQPLGMNETSFRLRDLDLSRVARPYERTGTTFTAIPHIGYPTYPDGLVRTSVPQLARFLAMFSNGGELDGKRILAASTVAEMQKLQVPALDDSQGLIWYFDTFGTRTVLGHDGADPGTSGHMYFDPKDGAGVLLVANGEWDDDAAEALLAKLFAESENY